MSSENEKEISEEVESAKDKQEKELERREKMALIRKAGTQIRKEQLERQQINAKLNINNAKRLLEKISNDRKDYAKSLDSINDKIVKIREKGTKALDNGDIEESSIQLLKYNKAVESFTGSYMGVRPENLRHLIEVNNFINNVINNIIDDLKKEGIYLEKLDDLELSKPERDLIYLYRHSVESLEDTIVILEGIIGTDQSNKAKE